MAWSVSPSLTMAQNRPYWNVMARQYAQRIGERFTVVCPARPRGAIRNAWGIDLYADFSSICEAALHAGAINASGGPVMIEMRPRAERYQGSFRNGVQSVSYGPAVSSFVVIPAGGAPPAGPQRVVYIYVNYNTRPATIGVADQYYNQPGWQRMVGPFQGTNADLRAWQSACGYHRQAAYNAPDIVQGRINCAAIGR
jgi:hypothetical protein